LQNFTGEFDGAGKLFLADLGAMRATKGSVFQSIQLPAGALCAGSRRKIGICRARSRRSERSHVEPILSDSTLLGGEEWPAAGNIGRQKSAQGQKLSRPKIAMIFQKCAQRRNQKAMRRPRRISCVEILSCSACKPVAPALATSQPYMPPPSMFK